MAANPYQQIAGLPTRTAIATMVALIHANTIHGRNDCSVLDELLVEP